MAPGAAWLAEIATDEQEPVWFIAIDGLSVEYSTAPVKAPVATKKVGYMMPPTGGGSTLDLLAGTQTVQQVDVEILDLSDELTDLVSVRAAGAPLSTLVNRKATIYGGFRNLDEADYEARFTGRIRGTAWNRDGTGYIFRLSDVSHMLDGQIMTGATDEKPAAIRGNIVNVYWSIMTGTFDTGDPTFPLDFVSTATATSSAPTGLGIATTLINGTQLVAQRDTWHINDVAHVVFSKPEDAREHLTAELFRIFQSHAAISGDGLLGLRFHVPSLPLSSAAAVTTDDIVEIHSWQPLYRDHLNKFTFKGDYSDLSRKYEFELYTTEDTTDQTNTDETIEYLAESRWIRDENDGAEIAWELANRLKIRYTHPPVQIELTVNAHHLAIEQGDVVRVTDSELVDLFDGTRGISDHMMTVLAIKTDWESGNRRLTLLDTGGRRYGLIAGDAQADFTSATTEDKETFFFISDDTGVMSDASDGYRFV